MRFDRIHFGLPDESPKVVRAALRSRVFLIVIVVTTIVLGIIAATNPNWLLRIDRPVSEWFRGTGGDYSFAKVATQLGSPNLAVAVGAIAVVALWRRCRASALTLVALIAAALATDIGLKILVNRPRPSDPAVSAQFGSFPSGHTISATVIFGLLPLLIWLFTNRILFLRIGFAVFAVAVVSVAVSRVRLGVHWPSDVIASFFIGASLLLAAEQLITSQWATNLCSMNHDHLVGSSVD